MTSEKKETRLLTTDPKIYQRLFNAIIEKNTRKVHAILKKYRFNKIDRMLALSAAVETDNLSATKLLLQNGFDRMLPDQMGRIALHKARSKQMVELLLQEKAAEQIDTMDYHGFSPIHTLYKLGMNKPKYCEALKTLMENASNKSQKRFLNTPTTNNLRIEYPINHFRQMSYRRGVRKGFSR